MPRREPPLEFISNSVSILRLVGPVGPNPGEITAGEEALKDIAMVETRRNTTTMKGPMEGANNSENYCWILMKQDARAIV